MRKQWGNNEETKYTPTVTKYESKLIIENAPWALYTLFIMKKNVLIFDFDGTIADTFRYTLELSNRISSEFNFNKIEPHEVEILKDKTSQEVIRYLHVPLLKIPKIVARAKWELSQQITLIEPAQGLREVLVHLKSFGHEMGILTSNSLENVIKFLNNHELNLFDFVSASSRIWGKNKCLNNLIQDKGFNPQEVLYIGDETRDIVAAKKAGIRIAAVTWGYNSLKALQSYCPDCLVHKPEELFQYIADLSVNPVKETKFSNGVNKNSSPLGDSTPMAIMK